MWRLNETSRGRSWELNSHGNSENSPWGVFTHPAQGNHATSTVLLNASLSKGTHSHSWCSAAAVGTCWSGEPSKEQLCLCPSAGAAPVWVNRVCWHCAEAQGESWALQSPLAPALSPCDSRVSCQPPHTCSAQSSDAIWLLKSVLGGNWSPAWLLFLPMFSFHTL